MTVTKWRHKTKINQHFTRWFLASYAIFLGKKWPTWPVERPESFDIQLRYEKQLWTRWDSPFNGWEPTFYISYMRQNFRLFQVSNLSVLNFRIFCSCIQGDLLILNHSAAESERGCIRTALPWASGTWWNRPVVLPGWQRRQQTDGPTDAADTRRAAPDGPTTSATGAGRIGGGGGRRRGERPPRTRRAAAARRA